MPENLTKAARVLVGESVWEDAQITVYEGFLNIEFDAKDLDSLAIPLAALPAEPVRATDEAADREPEP